MSASHTFPPFYAEPEPPESEYAAHCVWSEARALRSLPVADLALERALLEEAREFLNDALAKIAAAEEAAGMYSLWESANVH